MTLYLLAVPTKREGYAGFQMAHNHLSGHHRHSGYGCAESKWNTGWAVASTYGGALLHHRQTKLDRVRMGKVAIQRTSRPIQASVQPSRRLAGARRNARRNESAGEGFGKRHAAILPSRPIWRQRPDCRRPCVYGPHRVRLPERRHWAGTAGPTLRRLQRRTYDADETLIGRDEALHRPVGPPRGEAATRSPGVRRPKAKTRTAITICSGAQGGPPFQYVFPQ
jgi:hypothetical protein